MFSRAPLGLFSARYSTDSIPDESLQHPVLNGANVYSLDSKFQDIACLDSTISLPTGRVWVKCHPGDEETQPGGIAKEKILSFRKWGVYQDSFALVLPVRIETGSSDCCIEHYQIEIVLKPLSRSSTPSATKPTTSNNAGTSSPTQLPASNAQRDTSYTNLNTTPPVTGSMKSSEDFEWQSEGVENIHARCTSSQLLDTSERVSVGTLPVVTSLKAPGYGAGALLLDNPGPYQLERTYPQNWVESLIPQGLYRTAKWWRFCARSVTDPESGRSCTAQMTWEAVNHPPERLYCALPIEHPNEAFGITCRVSGLAMKNGKRYVFDNGMSRERTWQILPKNINHDLQKCIDTLNDQMLAKNSSILGGTKSETTRIEALYQPLPHGVRERLQTTIAESNPGNNAFKGNIGVTNSVVHMGNNYSNTTTQKPNSD